MKMVEKWTWAREEDQELWMNGQFDSKEEAIEQASIEVESEDRDVIFVGKCNPIIPAPPSADNIIDRMGDSLCDIAQNDLVDDYVMSISLEDESLLQEKLDNMWSEWLEETDNYPSMFEVIDIEKVNIKKE